MSTVLICQADIQEHAINKYRSVEGHVELLINECKLSFLYVCIRNYEI